jgi:hypothetical protein
MVLKLTKFIIFCSFFIFLNIATANAETTFTPEVGIGGDFTKDANVPVSNSTATIAEYIKQIYKYLIGVVAIIAVVVMMLGGITWITAGGSPARVGDAQAWIKASLTGLLLVMFSYVILKTVNPALVNFQVHSIVPVAIKDPSAGETGCCIVTAIALSATAHGALPAKDCGDTTYSSCCTIDKNQASGCKFESASRIKLFKLGQKCDESMGCPPKAP